jgi:FdhE protein
MTLVSWLSKHPYLQPVADFHAQIAEKTNRLEMSCAPLPDWQNYSEQYKEGIPFLSSSQATIDTAELERSFVSLLRSLPSMSATDGLKRQIGQLCDQCREEPDALRRAIAGLAGHGDCGLANPGLFRQLGWTVLARYLAPLVEAFEVWRDEECWFREYCPVCGAGPCMAQLVGTEPGRRRFLVCGCCRTRWRFQRMGCPFCEDANNHRITALGLEGERQMRIDYCDSCLGYLKTYDGEGSESVLLRDWTSFHLDVLARDRGLRRMADSLYEL